VDYALDSVTHQEVWIFANQVVQLQHPIVITSEIQRAIGGGDNVQAWNV
jgi:hypothetical protein